MVSVVTGVVILSPTLITADKSVLSILTTEPLVIAPLISSPVKAVVAVGYIFSPGMSTGAAPKVSSTNAIMSFSVGCLSIDKAPDETETVIDIGVVATLLPLAVGISIVFTLVLVITPPPAYALRVILTSKVWYITFLSRFELEPLLEFMSMLPSANLISL